MQDASTRREDWRMMREAFTSAALALGIDRAAARLDVHPSTVYRLLSATHTPHARTLARVAALCAGRASS